MAATGSACTVEPTVQFVDVDAAERYALLVECGSVRFEALAPVAPFVSFRGQRSWSGRWWSSTVGRHVAYRSWLARDHAMELDYDPHVLAYAARPFWLYFRDGLKVRRHGPDFFARRVDGTGVVIDCRSTAPVGRPDARVRGDGAGVSADGVGVPTGR